MARPLLLIHGYSDIGASFDAWKQQLQTPERQVSVIHTCNYETLSNEVTMADIAEGFDRALQQLWPSPPESEQEFDAIVHSTGMLVLRAWLTTYSVRDRFDPHTPGSTLAQERKSRLKHLIALAPATFGSPLAHKGRSWLGALAKGKWKGPDFLEAGDRVLDALELGSAYTWNLAHKDLLSLDENNRPMFDDKKDTPYVFVFCGTEAYPGIKGFLTNTDGSDGTVRWAGCALNSRKFWVNLTLEQAQVDRIRDTGWTNHVPLYPVPDRNHGSILQDPHPDLVTMVSEALQVESAAAFGRWQALPAVQAAIRRRDEELEPYQQFVIRVVDERGDPVPDFNLQLLTPKGEALDEFEADVHRYGNDASYRCFHLNLRRLKKEMGDFTERDLTLRLIASSGSQLVSYSGLGSERTNPMAAGSPENGAWDAVLELSVLAKTNSQLFYPFTTTLVEIKLNREPMPLPRAADGSGNRGTKVFWVSP
jgi:hypothetical protein